MADISLNKLTANRIAPTLYEKTTLSPVYYLFEFINKQTKVKSYCIPTELSNELLRYNKFTITDVASSPVPLSGQVSLSPGQYDYNVYEQSSSTNLNPSGLTIVESGIARVYSTTTYYTEYPVATVTNTQYE